MQIKPLVQTNASPQDKTIRGILEAYIHDHQYDCLQVAMAYVSIAGVRTLLSAFKTRKILKSQWLVGLDDAITQPGAIKLLVDLENSDVRIAKLSPVASRFHPKVALLKSSVQLEKQILMIGSANLTNKALAGNSETVIFLESKGEKDQKLFSDIWSELWVQGHAPTKQELIRYEKNYKTANKIRKKLKKKLRSKQKPDNKPKRILENDNAELDPSQANTCWIECGYITAMGRELEFKAEQGLFFGLEPSGGREKIFQFRVSNNSVVDLRMKYQQNHMWRLQMNNSVPEVQQGLRPIGPNGKLGRSDKVAVFVRTNDPHVFTLRFINLNSREFSRLKRESTRFGTIGYTSARSYGWIQII